MNYQFVFEEHLALALDGIDAPLQKTELLINFFGQALFGREHLVPSSKNFLTVCLRF
jgi:hypothetical protein